MDHDSTRGRRGTTAWSALRRVLAALFAACVVAVPAWATVVLRASVEDLAGRCTRAALVTVLSSDVSLDRERGRVWTTWQVRADETWIGEAAAEFAVSVPGGTAGGITQDFEGGATFEKGGRAAVFLWKDDDGRWLVLGEAQGAFLVRRDASTGTETCENSLDGLALVDVAGRTVRAKPERATLEAMRTRVAAAKKAREEREQREREERERKLEERRRRAEQHAEQARGKPGGPPAE